MIGPIEIGSENLAAQGIFQNIAAAPTETDDFNFMSYLLGLQIEGLGSNEEKTLDKVLQGEFPKETIPTGENVETPEDPLLALFNQGLVVKDQPVVAWTPPKEVSINPILSEQTAKFQIEGGEKLPQTLELVPDKTETSELSVELKQALSHLEFEKVDSKPPEGVEEKTVQTEFKVSEKIAKAQNTEVSEEGIQQYVDSFQDELKIDSVRVEESSPNEIATMEPEVEQKVQVEPMVVTREIAEIGTEVEVELGDDIAFLQVSSPQFAKAAEIGKFDSHLGEQRAKPVTVPELFNNVDQLSKNGGGKMVVSLNPPNLGQVQVEVMAQGNRVSVEMQSENAITRSILESGLGELKLSIQNQDLVVNKLEVNASKEGQDLYDLGSGSAFNQANDQNPSQDAQNSLENEGESSSSERGNSSLQELRIREEAAQAYRISNPYRNEGVNIRI